MIPVAATVPPKAMTSPARVAGEGPMRRVMPAICAALLAFLFTGPASAQNFGPDGGDGTRAVETITFENRPIDMYVPASLPASGARPLLVVLHGGMGNSAGVRRNLEMDGMADKYGFVIAYLNGTPSRISGQMRVWNAGACCGLAQRQNVDDAGYITAAVHMIEQKYGIAPNRVYGLGHSNGAMMTQRMMCETGLYQAAVAISGPLELDTTTCPAARGKRILAIHGTDDENVPIAGGRGKGIARVDFRSEDQSKQIFEQSGATYRLWAVAGATHKPESIRAAIARSGGSLSEDIVRFLGLAAGP